MELLRVRSSEFDMVVMACEYSIRFVEFSWIKVVAAWIDVNFDWIVCFGCECVDWLGNSPAFKKAGVGFSACCWFELFFCLGLGFGNGMFGWGEKSEVTRGKDDFVNWG